MGKTLEYKGYHANVEYSSEDEVLFGKIEGICDLINFESDNASEIVMAFHEAVDDYLEFCAEIGKSPDKEYKGSFNVRVKPETHKALSQIAFKKGESLNAIAEKAFDMYVRNEEEDGFSKYLPQKKNAKFSSDGKTHLKMIYSDSAVECDVV